MNSICGEDEYPGQRNESDGSSQIAGLQQIANKQKIKKSITAQDMYPQEHNGFEQKRKARFFKADRFQPGLLKMKIADSEIDPPDAPE
jgi:hypothetical protein